MPTISATRHEVSDRFEVLGFTVKTGRRPYFQVVLVSDLDALRDKGKRTPATFWASSPIAAEKAKRFFSYRWRCSSALPENRGSITAWRRSQTPIGGSRRS